jgi:hypothetical protein
MHQRSGNEGIPPWFLMTLGVIALIGLAAISIVRLQPRDESDALPPPAPAFTLPAATAGPQAPVSLVPSPSPSPSLSLSPTETRRFESTAATPTRTTRPPAGDVTGRYRVLESYGDSFIGEVLLTNVTGRPQSWRVTLVVPSSVTGLRTSWLESLPQPRLAVSGRTYTWTSSVDLAARSTGQLRFHFERDGGAVNPSSCTVDGASCR